MSFIERDGFLKQKEKTLFNTAEGNIVTHVL